MLRKALHIVVAAVLVFATVGIVFSQHYCNSKGKFIEEKQKTCCANTCCANNDCCTNIKNYESFDIEYPQPSVPAVISLPISEVEFFEANFIAKERNNQVGLLNPPPLLYKSPQSFLQVFII